MDESHVIGLCPALLSEAALSYGSAGTQLESGSTREFGKS